MIPTIIQVCFSAIIIRIGRISFGLRTMILTGPGAIHRIGILLIGAAAGIMAHRIIMAGTVVVVPTMETEIMHGAAEPE